MKSKIPAQVEQVPFPELPKRPTNYFKTECLMKTGKFGGFTKPSTAILHVCSFIGLGIFAKSTYEWVIEPSWRKSVGDYFKFTWNEIKYDFKRSSKN